MTSLVKPDFYKERLNKVVSSLTNAYQGLEKRVKETQPSQEFNKQFNVWLMSLSADKSKSPSREVEIKKMIGWLDNLPPAEAKAFQEQLATFCASLNFEVAWLVNDQLTNDPVIKQALEQSVLLYCLGHWQAVQVQDDITIFNTLRQWLAAPNKDEFRNLNQTLFPRLLDERLASEPPPQLFLASESERQTFIIEAIGQAIDRDRAAVSQILKNIHQEASRHAFTSLQEWLNVTSPEDYTVISQKLFGTLLAKGLVAEPPTNLFVAPEEERQAYIVQAISQAIEKDEATVQATLEAIKSADTKPAEQSELPTDSAIEADEVATNETVKETPTTETTTPKKQSTKSKGGDEA